MVSSASTCPRCLGSGKVSYRPANGMCYRCNGKGLVGSSNPEADRVIDSYRKAVPTISQEPLAIENESNNDDWLKALFS